jgi:hypothetical protein
MRWSSRSDGAEGSLRQVIEKRKSSRESNSMNRPFCDKLNQSPRGLSTILLSSGKEQRQESRNSASGLVEERFCASNGSSEGTPSLCLSSFFSSSLLSLYSYKINLGSGRSSFGTSIGTTCLSAGRIIAAFRFIFFFSVFFLRGNNLSKVSLSIPLLRTVPPLLSSSVSLFLLISPRPDSRGEGSDISLR